MDVVLAATAQAVGATGVLLTLSALRRWLVSHYLERAAGTPAVAARRDHTEWMTRMVAGSGALMLVLTAALLAAR